MIHMMISCLVVLNMLIGVICSVVTNVQETANEKGEIAVSDPDFAAEQFVSAVILSPFRRAALGITEAGYTPEIAERMDRSVNLFVYGCRPSVADSPSR